MPRPLGACQAWCPAQSKQVRRTSAEPGPGGLPQSLWLWDPTDVGNQSPAGSTMEDIGKRWEGSTLSEM